jgi:His/Glu/Gln/Arg/opine family amino acid ABC transporter permease subunit
MGILSSELTAIITQLASGLLVSVGIFILTLLFSLPLGLAFSFGRMSQNAVIRFITKIYISVMRGTPLMLQLMVIYFGPWYIFRIPLSHTYRYFAVIIGFVLNYAAYFAEIYRGGIESIGAGQYEAAKVLGFSKKQTFFRIILPQVVKRIMTSVTNEVITLVKDTSLAMVISVSEMFTAAQSLASAQVSIIPFAAAGIFYYIMNYAVAWSMELFEKRLSYYR